MPTSQPRKSPARRRGRRSLPFIGLLAVLAALAALIAAAGILPPGLADLLARAWPVPLVAAGLWLVLRDRVPVAGGIALIAALVLTGVMAVIAFQTRAAETRTDNQIIIAQTVDAVTLLRVDVTTLATQIEIDSGMVNVIGGEFVGARASQIEQAYAQAADGSASFTITERTADGLPLLDEIGRGVLRLAVPPGIPLDLRVNGVQGALTLNLGDLALERLSAAVVSGDVVVTLPDYAPRIVPQGELNGSIDTQNGDLAVFLPSATAARLELNRGGSGIEPVYDAAAFRYLVGDVLESLAIPNVPYSLRYTLTAPAGVIRVSGTG